MELAGPVKGYSPSIQCKRLLLFVDTILVEYGKGMSDGELEEIQSQCNRLVKETGFLRTQTQEKPE